MPRLLLAVLFAILAVPVLAQDASQPTGKRDLLIVIDCSGSMMGETPDGVVKLDAAKKVLGNLIEKLSPDLNAGLLAYGHRVLASDPGTCADIELVVPVVATDKALLAGKVRALKGMGRTPIAASLTKAGEILKALGTDREKSLIFVTDGLETCGGDPKAAAAALQALGIKLDFVVIGFDLADSEAKAIAAIAEAGKGKYIDAKNAKDLEDAFKKAHEAVVVKAPEVGKGEILGAAGPGAIQMVGRKEGEFPVASVLVAKRTDEVKDLPRGDAHGLVFADFFGLGVRIREVADGSPAKKAGIEPGDLVVRADDVAITFAKQLTEFLAAPATAEDAAKPWRLKVARFPLATEILNPWIEIDCPKQEVNSGDYYIFLSGSKGSNDTGIDGIDANVLKATGSWLSPLRWAMRVEPKMTVEVPLNTGFRFVAGQTKHEVEDEVRIVDDVRGVEILRFSAASLGKLEWEDAPTVISLPPGTYTMEWRRREGKTWFEITKGYAFDGNKLVDVKF
ncbi:MAG: VWA domain-containing protein [Planctomycetota bacterium]